MFGSLLSLFALSSLALTSVAAGPCHEDNCYRAVVRKWQGESVFQQHMANCSTNIGCTATAAPTTITSTATVASGTITLTRPAQTAAPTGAGAGQVPGPVKCGSGTIPSDQASQCENRFEYYATACGCAGIPTTTATQTATATVVVTVTEAAKIVYV